MTQPVLPPVLLLSVLPLITMLSIVDEAAVRVATFVKCIVVIISIVAAVVNMTSVSTAC